MISKAIFDSHLPLQCTVSDFRKSSEFEPKIAGISSTKPLGLSSGNNWAIRELERDISRLVDLNGMQIALLL